MTRHPSKVLDANHYKNKYAYYNDRYSELFTGRKFMMTTSPPRRQPKVDPYGRLQESPSHKLESTNSITATTSYTNTNTSSNYRTTNPLSYVLNDPPGSHDDLEEETSNSYHYYNMNINEQQQHQTRNPYDHSHGHNQHQHQSMRDPAPSPSHPHFEEETSNPYHYYNQNYIPNDDDDTSSYYYYFGTSSNTIIAMICVFNSWWWTWRDAMIESAKNCPEYQTTASKTLMILMTRVTELQTALYNDVFKKQVAAVGWLYLVWGLSLHYRYYGHYVGDDDTNKQNEIDEITDDKITHEDDETIFYWLHLAMIVPILILTPITRSYFVEQHVHYTFLPELVSILEKLQPRIEQDGYNVALVVDDGSWCCCPSPIQVHICFEPISMPT